MATEPTDADLARSIAKGQAGEAEALLCRRFAPRVELYGLKHLKGQAAAQDLAQQVMLKVLEALRAGRVDDVDNVSSFIFGTCRHVSWAPESLRYIGFSHTEGDECGSLGEWLELAPQAVPLCSRVAAMTFANDVSNRPVQAMADAQRLDLGGHEVTWFDTPHIPHGWDCGYLGELSTRTLLCGDLFTQAGANTPALTEHDLVGPSESMRGAMDYYSHTPKTGANLERLAAFEPRVLACMHGSAFAGNGGQALRDLAAALTA